MLTTLLLALAAWCVLSVPLAVLVGKLLARRPKASVYVGSSYVGPSPYVRRCVVASRVERELGRHQLWSA